MDRLQRIIVDGGSGAGKTTLARRLQAYWTRTSGQPVQLVSLDDLYPGWYGLADASEMVVTDVLDPYHPGFRRWDWDRMTAGDWVPLVPELPMVIEGCGALTTASAPLAQLRLWVELDEPQRRQRALSRADGEGYRPWWEVWAAQERAHWERNRPWELADLVVRPARG